MCHRLGTGFRMGKIWVKFVPRFGQKMLINEIICLTYRVDYYIIILSRGIPIDREEHLIHKFTERSKR